MRPSVSRACALLVVLTVVCAACGSSSHRSSPPRGLAPTTTTSPTTTALAPGCQPVPAPGPPLRWLPSDLPLPPGTYASADITNGAPAHRGVVVVPLPLRELIVFVLRQWPQAGYRLGRGDAEANEAEDSFAKSGGGAFRARSIYCDVRRTELLIVYANAGVASPTTTSPPTTGPPLIP